jgi:predicted RNA-binding protein Jag
MSAADRKAVHDALSELNTVMTRSEGEEPRRFVVVSPA